MVLSAYQAHLHDSPWPATSAQRQVAQMRGPFCFQLEVGKSATQSHQKPFKSTWNIAGACALSKVQVVAAVSIQAAAK